MAEDIERIAELFSNFVPVAIRRMFSGAGVFCDGLMIALVVDGVIYLKADESSIPDFEREGEPPFQYRSREGFAFCIPTGESPSAFTMIRMSWRYGPARPPNARVARI